MKNFYNYKVIYKSKLIIIIDQIFDKSTVYDKIK